MFGYRLRELELDCACKAIETRLLYEKTGNELYKILADGYQELSGRNKHTLAKKERTPLKMVLEGVENV